MLVSILDLRVLDCQLTLVLAIFGAGATVGGNIVNSIF